MKPAKPDPLARMVENSKRKLEEEYREHGEEPVIVGKFLVSLSLAENIKAGNKARAALGKTQE
jgi:hypothetical protein